MSHVKVYVKTGTFENETPDCLLVFWDIRCLDKVSDKSILLHLAGKEATAMWMEHRKKGRFKTSNVLVTEGGKLKCPKIFHVACDITSIITAAKDGLERANKCQMKTVVIPLLQNDTIKIDIDKCHKEIKKALKELTTVLNIVQSVTLVNGGNLPLHSEVVQKESKMHATEKKSETNKRNHRSVHNEKSDNPSRSAPKTAMAQNVSLDDPVHDPRTHLQPTKEANKRDQPFVNKEKSVKPSGSSPAETMTQNFSPDVPVSDVHMLQQPMTEANKRDQPSVNKEMSVKPSRSVPAKKMVQNVSPELPVHDVNSLLQPKIDVRGLEHVTNPIKVEQFQTPQDLDLHDPDGLVNQQENTGQKETPFTSLKEISGVVVTAKDGSDLTTHQMKIAKHYLESTTPDDEPSDHITSLKNVSEVEFKALQIIENGFKKVEDVHISWLGDSIIICGSPTLSLYVKQRLTRILEALRKKQSAEVSLDEEEKKIVRAVIGEVQSKDTICIYDEKMNQVVVYSLIQDDIRKFKHKLKIQTGKVKESGRSKQRFAENSPSLEECQENFDSLQKSKDIRQELSSSKNASDVEVFYTKENIKVAVYVANILHLPVDCIVNAANDSLSLGGGVAKVIADAAGSDMILQGNAAIMKNRNGKIPVGFQVTTTAGRLAYRCVIHTVGPCWADYKPHTLQKVKDCEKDLYRAIYGCFLEAEKNAVSSVALPAVSSGIYAVPQEMCAVQYAKAVVDYSRQSIPGKSLKEIHFIDKLPHLVKLMQDTFRTMIKTGSVPNYNIQNYVASSSHCQFEQSKYTGWKEHGKEDIPADNSQYETAKLKELSPFYYESKVHHTKQFIFQVSTKPVVCIYKGDILKVKNMDAIICPDDAKGSGIGRIAIDLGTKTKYRQQKEKCFERQKPDLGDVIITNGEENSFNMIVHVVIENNSPQKPEFKSTMKKSMDNILRKSNECVEVKTIALPLFGVRPELFTEKSWAELFLERFVAFCCEVKNPNLEEVHIITHSASSTAYSTVKKVFIEFADKVNKTQLQEKDPPPKLLPPKISRTSDHKRNDMGVNMVYQLDEKGSNASLQNKESESAFELMKDPSLKEGGKRVSPSISQSKMPLPSHWTSMKVTDVLQVPLDPKDTEAVIGDEYSMVKRDFDKTMSHAEIVSIKRIQNALLWEHYTLQKKEMEIKAGGVGLANEMQLYHGTMPDAVDLICHSNFDFRMAGERVGALLGQGAYFASNAKYSDCYAVTDDKNHKFMFVAKVLVGKTCCGYPEYKRPPYLDDNDKKRGTYNTCVNNVSIPTVYCVFDRNQYYPEYLVEYTL